VGADLINNSPGDLDLDGALTVFDFIKKIGQGNLDVVAGFGNAFPQDFLQANMLAPGLNTDVSANLALLRTPPFTTNTQIGVIYSQGLTALLDNTNALDRKVPDPTLQTNNLFDITVSSGSSYGAVNATYDFGGVQVNPFSFAFNLPGGTHVEVYPVADKANINVFPIPEPLSLAIWGLLVGAVIGWRTLRRKHA
jgi:hypothetical protein